MSTATDTTVLIAARDAEQTIARAIASCSGQQHVSGLLLVDDFSSDATVTTAEAAAREAGLPLRTVRPDVHRTLGHARQCGVEEMDTPFGMWLDADDVLLPGRVERLIDALECEQADFGTDGVRLFDGACGDALRDLPVPAFMVNQRLPARIFERNYLPASAHLAFRREAARAVGYDRGIHGPSDVDFLLRAVVRRHPFVLHAEIGYGMYTYGDSLSRDLAGMRTDYGRLLQPYPADDVRALYAEAGLPDRAADWALVAMALYRGEPGEALRTVQAACPGRHEKHAVLEPDGPCPLPEGWRYGFFAGTCHLILGEPQPARAHLKEAGHFAICAESLNNYGVALRRLHAEEEAKNCFHAALDIFPDYLDARRNCDDARATCITTHPLRREPSRHEYGS